MALPMEVLILILFATLGIFTVLSFKKKLLNFEGVLIANIVGIAIFILANYDLTYFFVALKNNEGDNDNLSHQLGAIKGI